MRALNYYISTMGRHTLLFRMANANYMQSQAAAAHSSQFLPTTKHIINTRRHTHTHFSIYVNGGWLFEAVAITASRQNPIQRVP